MLGGAWNLQDLKFWAILKAGVWKGFNRCHLRGI